MTVQPAGDLSCRELVELVTDLLEGALDEATEQRLLAHLPECEGCTDYLEQIRCTIELAGALPDDARPDDALPEGLLERLDEAYRARG